MHNSENYILPAGIPGWKTLWKWRTNK